MPVPVAPVDRQDDAVPPQLRPQGLDQLADLPVDRAGTPEMVVVLGDLQQSLPRNVPAPCHVLEERQDVLMPLGSTEADDQDRVVVTVG